VATGAPDGDTVAVCMAGKEEQCAADVQRSLHGAGEAVQRACIRALHQLSRRQPQRCRRCHSRDTAQGAVQR
jgi:hypothetical protein